MALALLALPIGWRRRETVSAQPQAGCSRTYTLDADFDEGILLNVNHDPDRDQLQLNRLTQPFPFVNIACSARGTAVRIDVNTGQILGEFLTAPNGMGKDPSRTTVDRVGNVWVSNRAEDRGGRGSVVRIGLIIGGSRVTADRAADPNGQYLMPPFQYNTCVDRDGDGLISTSRALGNILPWTNAGGADSGGGVSTADDECVINYTRVTGTGTRTVAVDANNDVWVGGLGDLDHEKLSGVTGQPIPGTQFNLGCGGYGGLVDGNGVLWSARGGGRLLRFAPNSILPPAGSGACLDSSRGDYGLAVDPRTGHIWHTTLSAFRVVELDANGNVLNAYPHGWPNAQGVAVDGAGNVWVAHSTNSTTVGRLRTDGTFVGNVPLPGGSGPTGVAVDANGKIWVANISSNNAMRIDPNAGPVGGGGLPVGAVDLTVSLGPGAAPYNYSDMTGFVALGTTAPSGTWTVVRDSGGAGTAWGTISWNGVEPAGTGIKVEARAADDQADLSSRPFQQVINGASFCESGVAGRYVEIRTTLSRNPGVNETPVLLDLSVRCCGNPPLAKCRDVTAAAGANCSAGASIDDGSFDPEGSQLTLTHSPAGPYALGITPVILTASDVTGALSQCAAEVTVTDQTPPAVTGADVDKPVLWPPDRRMEWVTVRYGVTDGCDPAPVCQLSASSSEGTEVATIANATRDIQILDANRLLLRAERGNTGIGRFYNIDITCVDKAGSRAKKRVIVKVPLVNFF